jgi:hypothetical protein
MATVVAVHGTFAHAESDTGSPASAELQWWEGGSEFERHIQEIVAASPDAGGGRVEVARFTWSGANSEVGRRQAGKDLLAKLLELEARGEPYCLVGHSHGGSVIGWALLLAAARKLELPGLRRWVTVGTPFVALEKETLLFQRLQLMLKVVFVASMMLLGMFLVYLLTEMLSDGRMLFGATYPGVLIFVGLMMSLPMIVFYVVLKYWDTLSLVHYRRRVRQRAERLFGPRWLALTHKDDEAVQGLAFLPGAKLSFFEKSFAVSAITTVSIIALPLLYIVLLASPPLMVGIGDLLRTHVYEARTNPEAERELRALRERLREARRTRAADAPRQAGAAGNLGASPFWTQYRADRQRLAQRFPELPSVERKLRFEQRFFERDGKPCEGGKICGGGHDMRINSGLLLHIVTDELSSAVAGEGADTPWQRTIWSLVIPAVLVPILFGLLALLLMLVIRTLAKILSHAASKALNSITNAEVKRAAFGNDTEGETAVGAVDRPMWIGRSYPRLPEALGDTITAYSNLIANNSLAKFRKAIGQLASAEPKHSADTAITTYFTWKELVHASYFDVPEFRKLVGQALSRSEGFAPSPHFQADPDYPRTAQWLAEIDSSFCVPPAPTPPGEADAGAVAAVVASTVKAAP